MPDMVLTLPATLPQEMVPEADSTLPVTSPFTSITPDWDLTLPALPVTTTYWQPSTRSTLP
jgi:hypothetical protein